MKEHIWGCACERCRNLIAAMVALTPDGEYFFTDEELEVMAEAEDNETA